MNHGRPLRTARIAAALTCALAALGACTNVSLNDDGGDDSGAADREMAAPDGAAADAGSRDAGGHDPGPPETEPSEGGPQEAGAASCPADAATALLGCPCPQFGDCACVTGEPNAFLVCREAALVPGTVYAGPTVTWQATTCPGGTRCVAEPGPPYAACTSGAVDEFDAANEDLGETSAVPVPPGDADSPCTSAAGCTGGDVCCAEGAPADIQGACQAASLPCGQPWSLQLCSTSEECLGDDVCGYPSIPLETEGSLVQTCNPLHGGVGDSSTTTTNETGTSDGPDGDASSSCTSAAECAPEGVCCAEGVAALIQGSCQTAPFSCGPPWSTQLCATSLECLAGYTCGVATSPALYFDGHPVLTCNPPDSGASGPEAAPGGD